MELIITNRVTLYTVDRDFCFNTYGLGFTKNLPGLRPPNEVKRIRKVKIQKMLTSVITRGVRFEVNVVCVQQIVQWGGWEFIDSLFYSKYLLKSIATRRRCLAAKTYLVNLKLQNRG